MSIALATTTLGAEFILTAMALLVLLVGGVPAAVSLLAWRRRTVPTAVASALTCGALAALLWRFMPGGFDAPTGGSVGDVALALFALALPALLLAAGVAWGLEAWRQAEPLRRVALVLGLAPLPVMLAWFAAGALSLPSGFNHRGNAGGTP